MLLRQIAFSLGMEGSKGYPTHACQYVIVKKINLIHFSMPSFKIASNLFIIFINKFNDSINMIYCANFIFIPRHPSDLEKIL